MASGRGNHLTKQIGEYLVAAELGRRGFIAARFRVMFQTTTSWQPMSISDQYLSKWKL